MLHFTCLTGAQRRPGRILSTAALGALLLVLPAAAAAPDRAAVNCISDKMRAVLKQSADVTTCLRRALAAGTEPDFTCINTAARQLRATFAKLEDRGGCGVAGEATSVERHVDECTIELFQTVSSNVCQPAGGSCESVFVPCCSGLACIAPIGGEATCR